MASPIAGNESFTNVENVAGQLKVLDVNNLTSFNLTAENATVDPASVYSDLAPTWEGLTPVLAVVDTTVLTDNSLNTVAFANGGAALGLILPSATVGNVVVIVQNQALADGATDAFSISAAGTDVFTTGSIITSSAANVLSAVVSADTNSVLTYETSTNGARNIWNLGAKIYFSCTTAGQWHINDEHVTTVLGSNAEGAWTFS